MQSDASLHVRRSDEPPEGLPEELDVLGVIVRPTDTLSVLRKACELCGVGKSGGKATVYRRLASYVSKHTLELQSKPSADEVIPQQVTPVAEPSTAERALHELTHLPFKAWCTVCMQNKGRSDLHKDADGTRRAHTVFSFDFPSLAEMRMHRTTNSLHWLCMTGTPGGAKPSQFLAEAGVTLNIFLRAK